MAISRVQGAALLAHKDDPICTASQNYFAMVCSFPEIYGAGWARTPGYLSQGSVRAPALASGLWREVYHWGWGGVAIIVSIVQTFLLLLEMRMTRVPITWPLDLRRAARLGVNLGGYLTFLL